MAVAKQQRELTTTSQSTCGSSDFAEYPAGLVVRNTFLDFNIQRPESLEGFIDERHVRSAPGSRLEEACGAQVPQTVQVPQHDQVVGNMGPRGSLQLAELITEPPLGSPDFPTVGSKNHGSNGCKPCAFIWKEQGCQNGVTCPFCHLCDAGEKKRRAKDKKEKVRSMRTGAGALHRAVVGGMSRFMS